MLEIKLKIEIQNHCRDSGGDSIVTVEAGGWAEKMN